MARPARPRRRGRPRGRRLNVDGTPAPQGGTRQFVRQLGVETRGKGLYEITRPILEWVAQLEIETGMLTVYIRHTSASLTIQENADPMS